MDERMYYKVSISAPFVFSAIAVFLAEFGDKTFFINCILAMTNNVYPPVSTIYIGF